MTMFIDAYCKVELVVQDFKKGKCEFSSAIKHVSNCILSILLIITVTLHGGINTVIILLLTC